MTEPTGMLEGVRAIDHTADVGLDIRAGSMEQLFHRAAAGMIVLIYDTLPAPADDGTVLRERDIAVEAEDAAELLALWLRELLYLDEVHGFVYRTARFDALDSATLRARVRGGPTPTPAVRELKGVTYHGLSVEQAAGGWRARVIFDV